MPAVLRMSERILNKVLFINVVLVRDEIR
ncbi:hypothetical protein NSND_61053 [Nitrospira sp. ND1]|nr:hypothetical protein NSND_61053 [Nitrospira sp. ND1]